MIGASALNQVVSVMVEAGSKLMVSVTTLAAAGQIADDGSMALMMGAIRLLIASDLLIECAESLAWAGRWLVPASFSIYMGMRWLEFAIERFSKTTENVAKISKAVSMLSNSFQALSATNLGALKDSASKALEAVPDIEQLGTRLMAAAVKLNDAVAVFRGPAEELAKLFERLSVAAANFGAGIKVTEDVAKLADMLDKYAMLLENTTERIEAAVKSRAVPAMKAAEEAGIEETIRSEAISTVKIMDETEGDVADDQEMENRVKMVELLQSLDDRLADMQTGNKGELTDILSLLQAHLPNMGKGDSGLGSEFNSWGK
jgi:hypothetical protein